MSDKLEVTINCDNIEIRDGAYQYVSIPIDQWQELKDAVDAKLSARKPNLSIRDRITTGFESAIQAQLKE